MKKKLNIALFAAILPVLLIALLFIQNITETKNNESITPEADWTDHYSNVDSLIMASDVIIEGKVVGSTAEQRFDLIFTIQKIEVDKVYSGDLVEGDTITLLQTGGKLDGKITSAFKEAPLMDKGGDYLLFLQYTKEGHYIVLGGYQGIGRIKNSKVEFSNVVNDEISKELSGKSLSSLNSILMDGIK